MSTRTLNLWGAVVSVITAGLFLAAAIALIVLPDGGLSSPLAPTLYYLGLILIVPTYITLYLAQAMTAGKLGFAAFAMSIVGSIMYSGPIFVLIAGTSGVTSWHDLWGFSMGNVLPLGASIFLIGSTMLGIATMRAGIFPRSSGLLLAIGSFLWLIAFYIPVPFLLSAANILGAIAMGWMGIKIFPGSETGAVQIRQTA